MLLMLVAEVSWVAEEEFIFNVESNTVALVL